jgi:hypothetical protein
MKPHEINLARETRFAKSIYGDLSKYALRALRELIKRHRILVTTETLNTSTGAGTLPFRAAACRAMPPVPLPPRPGIQRSMTSRWIFRAEVFKSRACKGFVGYGDADASKVSLRSSTAPRCGWLRPEGSIEPCARTTASASARSRRSDHLRNPLPLNLLNCRPQRGHQIQLPDDMDPNAQF